MAQIQQLHIGGNELEDLLCSKGKEALRLACSARSHVDKAKEMLATLAH